MKYRMIYMNLNKSFKKIVKKQIKRLIVFNKK